MDYDTTSMEITIIKNKMTEKNFCCIIKLYILSFILPIIFY